MADQNKPVDERYDLHTPEWVKKVASLWPGDTMSPKKMEYLLGQYGGWFYDTVAGLTDPTNAGKTAVETAFDAVKTGFVQPAQRAFVADPAYSNQYTNQFYDAKEAAALARGQGEAESKLASYYDKVSRQMGEYRDQERALLVSSLSKEEKEKRSREIMREMNALAKKAMETADEYYEKTDTLYKQLGLEKTLERYKLSDTLKEKVTDYGAAYAAAMAAKGLGIDAQQEQSWMAKIKPLQAQGVSADKFLVTRAISEADGVKKAEALSELQKVFRLTPEAALKLYNQVNSYAFTKADLTDAQQRQLEQGVRDGTITEKQFISMRNTVIGLTAKAAKKEALLAAGWSEAKAEAFLGLK
jgi:hypothetical protein